MENNFYRTSTVTIQAALRGGKTVLKDVYFTAPFKIMNPFYMKKDFMTLMCMSSASGIMAGDVQEFNFQVDEGARFEFISQSYEKIHKMNSGCATRTMEAHIDRDAIFYYNPLPTQPFKDSAFESIVNVHLKDSSSRFIMKEIITGGRCLRGEKFEYKFYHNLVSIYVGDEILYRDNTRFEPSQMDLMGLGMHEGYTHLGSLILIHEHRSKEWIASVHELLNQDEQIEGGITTIDNKAIVIRVLGHQGEHLERVLDQIMSLTDTE